MTRPGTPPVQGRLLANRYRLLDSLGRGGMGVVWRARDELLGRDVAVKEVLLPPELPDEERAVLRQRSLREARSAARLSHPNVVTMYDVVEEEDRPWIVMELVPSRSLADVVEEDGPLPSWRVAEIGLQVLAALQAAHPAGILHRDVKPSNVLLADDGRVVLTDFGIATLEGDPSLTMSGALLGSPAYIAPERVQARGAGPASDLWSLGATLYAAVEGRTPHDRGAALPTLTAAVTEQPDPPRLAGPLWPALEGLLRKDPAERIDAAEAKRLLREAAVAPAAVGSDDVPPAPVATPVAAKGKLEWGDRTRVLPVGPLARQPVSEPPRQPVSEPVEPVSGPSSIPPVAPPGQSPTPPAEGEPRSAAASQPVQRRLAKPLSAVVACLALVGALLGWLVLRPNGGDGQAQQGSSGTESPRATATRNTQAPRSPSATSRPATAATNAPTNPPTRLPTAGQTSAVPVGFQRHRDQTGFSLAVPSGWTVERQGQLVYFREPAGSRFLLVDQTNQPKPDPVADWRRQELARKDGYPAYQRIRIEAVDYFEKAADWEFTYAGRNGRRHVLNRGVVTSGHQAYGLYWSTPDSQWESSRQLFRSLTETFQPAP